MKSINYLKIAVMIFGISLMFGACKSSKKTVIYTGDQNNLTTTAQQNVTSRGTKQEVEECEELAMLPGANLRDAGNGISDREAFATNLALLDARSKLAQQLEVLVNGLTRNFNQQHESGVDQLSSVAKAGQIQQGYFEQFLANTRQICKTTYLKDGKYNVYVCVEMDVNQQRAMYKKLTNDKMLQTDYQEYQFLKDMEKAKEEYKLKQLE